MSPLEQLVYSALAWGLNLLLIARIAREAFRRKRAGPDRFRLPLASFTEPQQETRIGSFVVYGALLLLCPPVRPGTDPSSMVLPSFFLWMIANNLQASSPRRGAHRWRTSACGAIALLIGVLPLAVGSRELHAGDALYGISPWFLYALSFAIFVFGALALEESIAGTRVRHGGIEMLATTRPWSRVVFKGWGENHGESVLCLSIVPRDCSGSSSGAMPRSASPTPPPNAPRWRNSSTGTPPSPPDHGSVKGVREAGAAWCDHRRKALHRPLAPGSDIVAVHRSRLTPV
jgi:hypothetical protein